MLTSFLDNTRLDNSDFQPTSYARGDTIAFEIH